MTALAEARGRAATAVVRQVTVACQSDAAALWEKLADTERNNRLLGLSRVSLTPQEGDTAARWLAVTSLGGLSVSYEERPFEWIWPRSFKVLRRMRSGPLHSLEVAWSFGARAGGGTDVSVTLTLEPRVWLLTPFIRFMSGRTIRGFEAMIRGVDAALSAHTPDAFAPPRSPQKAAAFERAGRALRELAGESRALCDRLLATVERAEDTEVSRLRPFALADAWGEDRAAVLALCLVAVRAGLLELRWEVVCPSCRIATDVLPTLASLSEHGACQLCDLDFALDLEDAVEATFAPVPAVREADVGPYCSGGPARTPHVLAQAILPARGEVTIPCPDEEGRYRLFVRGGARAPLEVRAGGPEEARVEAERPGLVVVAPGGRVVVASDDPRERHVKLERLETDGQAARARVVTAMPGFRRDFSSDVLRPGLALKIARVGLFFSDLTGSTQLYAEAGDAAAFKLVQDHFEVVVGLVEKHQGSLVKTIGDAVMAVFADDLAGLVASIEILHAFEAFRRAEKGRERTHIKLGVYGGSCYAVTANGVLDYFGQTVNIAARLQGEARSGELVVEEALLERALEMKAIPPDLVVERYEARLKGVGEPIRAARLQPRA